MDRQKIFEYVLEKYNTRPEYLWMKYPTYAVLRHENNGKWYGIVMNVPRCKLGLDGNDTVDILDVKCEPLMVDMLCRRPGFFPGYHMNKANWVSILLDGTVPDKEVFSLLDESFACTAKRKK